MQILLYFENSGSDVNLNLKCYDELLSCNVPKQKQ